MRAALSRRRTGPVTFLSTTSWARPTSLATTPAGQQKPFTTISGMNTLLTNAVAGDYIYYNGSGILTQTSSSGNGYNLTARNYSASPAIPVTLDLGTRTTDIWSPAGANNYVKFSYTGASSFTALLLANVSNMCVYGGEYDSGTGGDAILIEGPTSNVTFWDAYVSKAGESGIGVAGILPSGGNSTVTNLNLRAEVTRFSMNPARDNHADKGTGFHGAILHGASGTFSNSVVTIYAHNPLQPGEVSAGNTWPEGAGGCAVEIGQVGGNNDNLTIYVKGEDMNMIPNATNPGSTGSGQTGGNVINFWGNVALNGCIIGWAEGNRISGAVTHGTTGAWYPGSPVITVQHGRHSNTNGSTAGGNISTPYDSRWGINYGTDSL
jgi:hypothetical protein